MTSTYRQLKRQWDTEMENAQPDPTLIGELYLAMQNEVKLDAAYQEAMARSFHDDPTGQDYEAA